MNVRAKPVRRTIADVIDGSVPVRDRLENYRRALVNAARLLGQLRAL